MKVSAAVCEPAAKQGHMTTPENNQLVELNWTMVK